jgi:hypothetical protein
LSRLEAVDERDFFFDQSEFDVLGVAIIGPLGRGDDKFALGEAFAESLCFKDFFQR